MFRRSSKFVAFAFFLAAAPALVSAQPNVAGAADAAKGAVSKAVEQAGGLEKVLAGGDFKTLSEALNKADLTKVLATGGPYTIFAPTDEAFKKIPEADLKALLADKDALTKVLKHHVVEGKVSAADATKLDGKAAKTLAGDEAAIKVVDGKVTVGGATVTKADVAAGNSVVHVVDTVILPAKAEKAEAKKEEKKAPTSRPAKKSE